MKIISLLLIAMAVFITGCKKSSSGDSNSTPATKTYLVSQVTTTSNPGTQTSVIQFTYDSKNRMVGINASGETITYTYDDNNNLTSAVNKNSTGNTLGTATYTYSGNTITDNYVPVNGTSNIQVVYAINSEKAVQGIKYYVGNSLNASEALNYDSKGNITRVGYCCNPADTINFTFDDKKSPFSMLGAPNFDFQFENNLSPYSYVNNIATGTPNTSSITYTYNSDGFPVTVVRIQPYVTYTDTYQYITK